MINSRATCFPEPEEGNVGNPDLDLVSQELRHLGCVTGVCVCVRRLSLQPVGHARTN